MKLKTYFIFKYAIQCHSNHNERAGSLVYSFWYYLEIMDTTNHISITSNEIYMCVYCSESQDSDEYALQAVQKTMVEVEKLVVATLSSIAMKKLGEKLRLDGLST